MDKMDTITEIIPDNMPQWVAMLPGWDQSTGIKAEIEIAEKMGKPVSFVDV